MRSYFQYTIKLIMADVGQTGMSGEQSRRCLVLIQICFNVIHVYIIKQLMIFNFGEYKNWSTHGTWYSPRHSMGWSIPVFTSSIVYCHHFLSLWIEILTWFLEWECIVISYRSTLKFVPVEWFLANLQPLGFEIWPNI